MHKWLLTLVYYGIILMGIILMLLSACQQQNSNQLSPTDQPHDTRSLDSETNLFFTTLAQDYWIGGHGDFQTPAVIVVANLNEITKLDGWVKKDIITQLSDIDYDSTVVVAVFQGLQPSSGYGVEVERVAYVEDSNSVKIFARFDVPQPDRAVLDILTSPYHIIGVPRVSDQPGDLTFELIVDGTLMATYVP